MWRMPRTYSSQLDGVVLLGELARLGTGGIVVEELCANRQTRRSSVLVPPVEREAGAAERSPCPCEGRTFFCRFEMALLTSGRCAANLPIGSRTVARYGASCSTQTWGSQMSVAG